VGGLRDGVGKRDRPVECDTRFFRPARSNEERALQAEEVDGRESVLDALRFRPAIG
jgi:hypothetical protein